MKKQNNKLVELVKLLNTGDFHDGNELGKKLGITRSAVWKIIKKLKNYEIDIKSVKGKGYCLSEDLVLYEKELILGELNKHLLPQIDLKIFESITSTNDYLKTINFQDKIVICVAEEQTKGRGRFARYWHSPFGQNIYLSICLDFTKDISSLMGASLVVGLAVLKTIKKYGIEDNFFIKWPNNILWDNKKIAGILIDANAEINGNCKLIIGVGLNLNMITVTDSNDSKPRISLKEITGYTIDKNKMVALLINSIFSFVKKFETEGLSAFMEQWNKHDYLCEKAITVGIGNTEEEGICKGIDQHGRLVLQLSNGKCKAFASGDATILQR